MVEDSIEGMSAESVMSLPPLTQYFDTPQAMADKSDPPKRLSCRTLPLE